MNQLQFPMTEDKDTEENVLSEANSEQAKCKWVQVLPQQRAISVAGYQACSHVESAISKLTSCL